MSNRQLEMKQIRRLIGNWMTEIRLNNYENYYDINKVGEHLSRQLLNAIYQYDLKDLNDVKANFPGLDLGDETKALVAFQVTSRTDNRKINESLMTVVSNNYDKCFTKGIKFLILNDVEKVSFGKKVKKLPSTILATFNPDDDILYPDTLIKKIEEIYENEADLLKFNQVKLLLEKELIPLATSKPAFAEDPELAILKDLFSRALEALDKEKQELNISRTFFTGNLQTPHLLSPAARKTVVNNINTSLHIGNLVWLQGAPSTGKTSLAVLVAETAGTPVIWIDCRDVKEEQLIEHIVLSLTHYLRLNLALDYIETLNIILKQIVKNTLIIFNDIPNIESKVLVTQQMEKFVSIVSAADIQILATSNYRLATNFGNNLSLKTLSVTVPPFDDSDTIDVLRFYGASDDSLAYYARLITLETHGHPLLIQSAARYLQQKGWVKDAETFRAIFKGDFGDQIDRAIYAQVLEHTTSASSRELLYRLRYVVGDFSLETVQRVAAITEPVAHPGEILSAMIGTWVQPSSENTFQLSPLVKRLNGNISLEAERNICIALGKQIVDKKNISQIDAYKAIYYFVHGHHFSEASFVLYKVLIEFTSAPELFFDWGFDSFWYYDRLPDAVAPFLKTVIRVSQIQITLALKKDVAFLGTDLKAVIDSEDVGTLALGIAYMSLFMIEAIKRPLIGMNYLMQATQSFELDSLQDFTDTFFKTESLNGIWQIFSLLHTRDEYEQWFSLAKPIKIPEQIYNPYQNEMYAIAGASIYRNAVLKGKNDAADIIDLLQYLIRQAANCNFLLLATYSLRYLVKFVAEELHDWPMIIKYLEEYSKISSADPLYKFLVFSEVGRQYFLDKNISPAEYYIEEVSNIIVPAFYTEYLDFLIFKLQVASKKDIAIAANIALRALEIALQDRYSLEDKVKLYGEAAIGHTNLGDLAKALEAYTAGYALLLDNFKNSEDHQALVIRYGNALKYLLYLIEGGISEKYPTEKSVIPGPGYFYRTNQKLLEGGYYFEERKFMVSSALQSAFEEIGNYEESKRWAYKSIELSLELKEGGRFVLILQSNLFYVISDRQYRQAYNVQAHIDKFYTNLYEKIERGEQVDEQLPSLMRGSRLNDLSVYTFILWPVTFLFSRDIMVNAVREEQYQAMINDAFEYDKYPLKDGASFIFTKILFERILIDRIAYAEMQELFKGYHGDYHDIIYIMGCILLSSLVGATEAANLQLAVIKTLDTTMRRMKAAYRFMVVPFFEQFWKSKLAAHPKEFSGSAHLATKGFTLIDKTDWSKKVATIFRILSDHLSVEPSRETRDFIGI